MENGESVGVTARAKLIVALKRDGRIAASLREAEALAAAHPSSLTAVCLLGDLHYAAAIRDRGAAAGSEEEPADVESHLRQAREALSTARSLAPDNADIAVALADLLAESSMYLEAEAELRRAMDMDAAAAPKSSHSPVSSTPGERKQSYQRVINRLVAQEAGRLMDVAKSDDAGKQKLQALKALKEARDLAKRFPGSARARLLGPFVELKYMLAVSREHKDPAWGKGVERLVCDAVGVTIEFPNSTAAALFHARLLFVSGKHIDAEGECHRALALEYATDPEEDCIPPGSIRGGDSQSRLSSVAGLFHELLDKILQSGELYWENCLTSERRQNLLSVRIDVLENECKMVSQSYDFSVSSAFSFFKKHRSWRSWVCPICNAKHTDTSSLLKHMVKKHSRSVLPRLQDIVDSTAEPENDCLLEGLRFGKDSENHDTICFKETTGIFRLLFSEPNRGEVAKPVDKTYQDQQSQGILLLKNIKKNMANLPTHKSTTYESSNLQEIRDLWLQFLKCAVLDYGKSMVKLARSYLWVEFRKCMAGDGEALRQKISTGDIETTFSTHSSVDEEANKEEVHCQTGGETTTLCADQDIDDFQSSNSKGIDLIDTVLRDELKKCMAGDGEALRQKISTGDIETTFSTHSAVDEETNKEEVHFQTGETTTLCADQDIDDFQSSNSKGINLIDTVLRTLWCMEQLIAEVTDTEPICSKDGHNGPCVGVIVHKILRLWKKKEDHRQELLSLAKAVCRTLEDDNCFDEWKDKGKHASDITAAILNGLHLPDVCLHLAIISDTMRPETKAVVCKYHDPLDMKPMRPMGCGCITCSAGELCAEPTKVEHICKQCNSAALNEPYSAIVIHWSMKMEVQQSLAEIWDDVLQPVMTFAYNHGTTFYSLAAMICYLDTEPIGIARSEYGWVMYDASREINKCQGPWEDLLAMCRDCTPAILFYEVIK